MFGDLSDTISVLLRKEGAATTPPLLSGVEVTFDRPTDAPAGTTATLNLFLYDLREDAELRSNEPDLSVAADGSVTRLRPPLRVDCSYVLTAWPDSSAKNVALAEQQLLGQAIQVLARHELIPEAYRQGQVKKMDPPPRLWVAVGGAERGRSLAEFWSAVGIKLRPAVMIRATVAVDANPVPAPAGDTPVTAVSPIVREADPTAPPPESATAAAGPFFVAGGRVTRGGLPAPGAVVTLAAPPRTARADDRGVFRLGPLPAGTYAAVAALDLGDGPALTKAFQVTVPEVPGTVATVDLGS